MPAQSTAPMPPPSTAPTIDTFLAALATGTLDQFLAERLNVPRPHVVVMTPAPKEQP